MLLAYNIYHYILGQYNVLDMIASDMYHLKLLGVSA